MGKEKKKLPLNALDSNLEGFPVCGVFLYIRESPSLPSETDGTAHRSVPPHICWGRWIPRNIITLSNFSDHMCLRIRMSLFFLQIYNFILFWNYLTQKSCNYSPQPPFFHLNYLRVSCQLDIPTTPKYLQLPNITPVCICYQQRHSPA